MQDTAPDLKIGWAQVDITPEQPVLIAGQFHARLSEGVLDPLSATAWALDSGDEQAVMVSCDVVSIPDPVRDAVRARVGELADDVDPMKVMLNATHSHSAPELRMPQPGSGITSAGLGVDLPAMPTEEYAGYFVERIAQAIAQAWQARTPGKIAFGLGTAVIGRNRRIVEQDGKSIMYGNAGTPAFSHIEGYEDHSLNVLATYEPEGKLTGLVVNVPCPSQVSEHIYQISADYWCEARRELRQRFGEDIFILPQCSAAGDQSPRPIFDKPAEQRMLELSGRTLREEIAHRIATGVAQVLEAIDGQASTPRTFRHAVATLALPANALTEDDVRDALADAEQLHERYEQLKQEMDADPGRQQADPRWYVPVTAAFRRASWLRGVAVRHERQQQDPTLPAEVHVLRLDDLAIATNPFEYYLDFGVAIKARSPAVQTFVVQLTGAGTYVPSQRSTQGGGYGSVPASNPVGPEGGQQLAEHTVETLGQLWNGA